MCLLMKWLKMVDHIALQPFRWVFVLEKHHWNKSIKHKLYNNYRNQADEAAASIQIKFDKWRVKRARETQRMSV